MLAKDRADRPQTPADLRREIEACLRESGQSVPVLPGSEAPPLRPAVAPAPPPEPLVAETLLDPPPDAEPTGFTLEDALRQSEGRLPAALVANLLTPLAQILDAAAPVALDLAPNAVRVVAAPPGSTPHAAAFTDPWLTGGQPGRLELRRADAVRPASPSVNETLPPRRAGFTAPAAALAALAYELIGGRPPAGQDYRPLAECGELANRHLRRALTDPAAPFADAGAFADAFARSLDQRAATEVPAIARPTPPRATPAFPPPPEKKRGCAVNVVVTVVAALLVVAVVGKLAFFPVAGPSASTTALATPPLAAPPAAPTPTPDVRLVRAREFIEAARREIEPTLPDTLKADALADIAVAQARAGDVAEARQNIERVRQMAMTFPVGFPKGDALRTVASVQAKAGDVAEARQTAEGITDPISKAYALEDIALVQARAGHMDEARQSVEQALQTAKGHLNEIFKASVLAKLAVAQTWAGDTAGAGRTFAEARQMVADSTEPFLKAHALVDIAVAQAQVGDVAGARQSAEQGLRSARTMQNGPPNAATLADVAVAQARTGDIAGARQTLGEVTAKGLLPQGFIAIALAQARAGDLAGARQTAGSITDVTFKSYALAGIAAAQARAGDMAGAEETVRSLAAGNDRGRGYLAIANALLAGPDAPDDEP